jgi:hypothetical protein
MLAVAFAIALSPISTFAKPSLKGKNMHPLSEMRRSSEAKPSGT